MAAIDEKLVAKVVGEVLARLKTQQSPSAASGQSGFGVYEDMNAAIEAAQRSFEKLREGFVANPVAQAFLAAQEEMQGLRDTINDHVGKTFELGRVPKASDFAGSCGTGCGCEN